jgi:hypothetical protein
LVSWNGTHLKWTQRVQCLPVARTVAAFGAYDMTVPTAGSSVTYYRWDGSASSITDETVTIDGFPLANGRALYYELPNTPDAPASTPLRYRIVDSRNTQWVPTANWILLAVNNVESGLRWMPGLLSIPNSPLYLPALYNSATEFCSWFGQQFAASNNPTFTSGVNVGGTLTVTGQSNLSNVSISGQLSIPRGSAMATPVTSLNSAWSQGQGLRSRLGRWTGQVNGGNLCLRVHFATADYGTADSISEITILYTMGRTNPSTNVPATTVHGDGWAVVTSPRSDFIPEVYVVPIGFIAGTPTIPEKRIMDFWITSGGFPGDRVVDASTGSSAVGGLNSWQAEQAGTFDTVWPPTTIYATELPGVSPIPFRRLQSTLAYNPLNSQLQTKPWVAGRIAPGGSGTLISNSGQQTPLTLTRRAGFPSGNFILSWSAAHPSGSNYGVIVSTSTNGGTSKYHTVTATSFQLTFYQPPGTNDPFEDPLEFTFMTLP